MAENREEKVIPSIMILSHPSFRQETPLQNLCWGMEEEGIPYTIEENGNGDAVKLAYQAAQDSTLGVGVGIDNSGQMALHFHRLPPEAPLFIIHGQGNGNEDSLWRKLGANAARLVKGIPFKPLVPDTEEEILLNNKPMPENQEGKRELDLEMDMEDLVQLVTKIVVKVLAEKRGA